MSQSEKEKSVAVIASEAPVRAKPSNYPEPFASRMAGREKRRLGELFGLRNFGVNLTRMIPGANSSLRHAHSRQDEFIYILEGHPTLMTDEGETVLAPGMCAGFAAGSGNAHQLINRSSADVVYLEIGDRTPDDAIVYPDDDLQAALDDNGNWRFEHKDGTPY
ncbi:cupin domain-containing protein [Uliginosibacterium sp. sgz301328]|uniref:cupin domain-containing protein n=1 Tax=Uliginosibacterium sp. sgz301328 TaxID=3243764 RepID=UPI00359CCC2F